MILPYPRFILNPSALFGKGGEASSEKNLQSGSRDTLGMVCIGGYQEVGIPPIGRLSPCSTLFGRVQRLHLRQEFLQVRMIHRLDQMGVEPDFLRPLPVPLLPPPGQSDE